MCLVAITVKEWLVGTKMISSHMHNDYLISEYTPSGWDDLRDLATQMSNWVFRGQSNSEWALTTTLERAAQDHGCDIRKIPQLEQETLRQFRRRASNYVKSCPDKNSLFEWLALMQHHGAPTRLLDFTYSFYVACFFALERTTSDAAIYCLNSPLIECHGNKRNTSNSRSNSEVSKINTPEYCDEAIKKGVGNPLVVIAEPFIMNERLAAQHGLFAVPCEIHQSFEYNLSLTCSDFGKHLPKPRKLDVLELIDINRKSALLKLIIPKEMHNEIRLDLKKMNINAATLFPGLDGFARSLFDHFPPNGNSEA